eukprot:6204551-Pleurochrysis_carterae.AAC.1
MQGQTGRWRCSSKHVKNSVYKVWVARSGGRAWRDSLLSGALVQQRPRAPARRRLSQGRGQRRALRKR